MPADGEVRASEAYLLLKCHLPIRKSKGRKKGEFTETEQTGASLCLDCLVVRGNVTAGKTFTSISSPIHPKLPMRLLLFRLLL